MHERTPLSNIKDEIHETRSEEETVLSRAAVQNGIRVM